MKKYRIIIIAALIVVFTGCVIYAVYNKDEKQNKISESGEILSSSVKALSENSSSSLSSNDGNSLLNVMGENISYEYFNVRAALWKACGAEDPVNEALNSMKKEAAEKDFAIKHDLFPTENEIEEYVASMKKEIESTQESLAIANELLSTIGLSYDYYWNEYKPKFEAPAALIHINVCEYIEKNNLPDLDYSEVEYMIINRQSFDELNRMYSESSV